MEGHPLLGLSPATSRGEAATPLWRGTSVSFKRDVGRGPGVKLINGSET